MGQWGVRVRGGGCRHGPRILLTLKSEASERMLVNFKFLSFIDLADMLSWPVQALSLVYSD